MKSAGHRKKTPRGPRLARGSYFGHPCSSLLQNVFTIYLYWNDTKYAFSSYSLITNLQIFHQNDQNPITNLCLTLLYQQLSDRYWYSDPWLSHLHLLPWIASPGVFSRNDATQKTHKISQITVHRKPVRVCVHVCGGTHLSAINSLCHQRTVNPCVYPLPIPLLIGSAHRSFLIGPLKKKIK